MNFKESFATAINSLMLNKLRAALTMIGIIIGVAAVISMVSIGRGIGNFITGQFEGLGATRMQIYSIAPTGGLRTRIEPLTSAVVEALANPQIAPQVQAVAAEYQLGSLVRVGSKGVNVTVTGATANYSEVMNWRPRPGDPFITDEDVQTSARVALLGTSTIRQLFGSENFNPVGLQIDIDGLPFMVIGVMQNRANILSLDPNNVVLIPITTAQTRLDNARVRGGALRVSNIIVLAQSQQVVGMAARDIRAYLREQHQIANPTDDDFEVFNEAQQLDALNKISGMLTVFLAVIGGISLLVGGIGIMNIMLVSVTERTREIGLRKAVGARSGDILSQFLIESVLLCLLGGLLGVGLSLAVVLIGNVLVPTLKLALALDMLILAVVVSSTVGTLFGLYPANRAAHMRPIDALRFE